MVARPTKIVTADCTTPMAATKIDHPPGLVARAISQVPGAESAAFVSFSSKVRCRVVDAGFFGGLMDSLMSGRALSELAVMLEINRGVYKEGNGGVNLHHAISTSPT